MLPPISFPRWLLVVSLALATYVGARPGAFAQEPDDLAARVAVWRDELASNEYLARDAATRELTRAGLPAGEAVADAAGDADREVSLRGFRIVALWIDSPDRALRDAAEAILDELQEQESPHVVNEATRLQLRFAVAAQEKLTELGVTFSEAFPFAGVGENWKGTVDDLRLFRKLSYLERLGLAGERVDDAWIDALGKLEIDQLILRKTSISGDGLRRLANFSRMTELVIAESPLHDADLAGLVSLRSLTSLALDGVPIEADELEALSALPNLRELRLSRTRIPSGGFASLMRFRKLESLDVRRSKFELDDLLALAEHPRLKAICARSTRLSPVDVDDLRREFPRSTVEVTFDDPEAEP